MKIGDIVRWYEDYPEGFTKCSGLGSIQKIKTFKLKDYEPILLYKIWRFEYNDIVTFENENVELAINEQIP